jgi:hypothetical protein
MGYKGEYAIVFFDFRRASRRRGGFRSASSAEELLLRARLTDKGDTVRFEMETGRTRRMASRLVR